MDSFLGSDLRTLLKLEYQNAPMFVGLRPLWYDGLWISGNSGIPRVLVVTSLGSRSVGVPCECRRIQDLTAASDEVITLVSILIRESVPGERQVE